MNPDHVRILLLLSPLLIAGSGIIGAAVVLVAREVWVWVRRDSGDGR